MARLDRCDRAVHRARRPIRPPCPARDPRPATWRKSARACGPRSPARSHARKRPTRRRHRAHVQAVAGRSARAITRIFASATCRCSSRWNPTSARCARVCDRCSRRRSPDMARLAVVDAVMEQASERARTQSARKRAHLARQAFRAPEERARCGGNTGGQRMARRVSQGSAKRVARRTGCSFSTDRRLARGSSPPLTGSLCPEIF